MIRRDHILILAKPDGTFHINPGMGWMPCTEAQTDFIRRSPRIRPTFVDRHDIADPPCRSNEVPLGLQAFGEPFFVAKRLRQPAGDGT